MRHLFSYAFRPCFTLAILFGAGAIAWWGLAWSGWAAMPGGAMAPSVWHGHEMLFGFVGAAIAGFSLTAVASWTRRPPVAGPPLMLLCALWLAARGSALADGSGALLLGAGADLGFDALLCGLLAREVIAARNWRNLKLIGLLLLFTAANAACYWQTWHGGAGIQRALWGGVFVVALLVNLIGGRIVPAFTGNWLQRRARSQGLPPPALPPGHGRCDALATAATLTFAVLFLIDPDAPVSAAAGVAAALAQALRLARWRGLATAASPLVWILHVAYLWLPLGLLLTALGCAGQVDPAAGLHALTAGAFSTLLLAVASRAALGHTNRPLADHPLLTASYLGITASAALRVAAALHPPAAPWLALASLCWVAALACFGLRYLPILLGPPQPAGTG